MAETAFKVRADTTEGWNSLIFAPVDREVTLDRTRMRLKVGDGTTLWKDLPYVDVELIDNLEDGGSLFALTAEQGKVLKNLLDQKAGSSDLDELRETVEEIGSREGVEVYDDLDSDEADVALSANMGRKLNEDKVDRSELEELQEIVETIDIPDGVIVENSLTSTSTGNALSANMGRELNNNKADRSELEALQGIVQNLENNSGSVEVLDSLTSTSTTSALSANKGRELNNKLNSYGVFGMGYSIDSFDANGKPTKITFADGVECTLEWKSGYLWSISASTGEVMTMNYDANGRILGRTITG